MQPGVEGALNASTPTELATLLTPGGVAPTTRNLSLSLLSFASYPGDDGWITDAQWALLATYNVTKVHVVLTASDLDALATPQSPTARALAAWTDLRELRVEITNGDLNTDADHIVAENDLKNLIPKNRIRPLALSLSAHDFTPDAVTFLANVAHHRPGFEAYSAITVSAIVASPNLAERGGPTAQNTRDEEIPGWGALAASGTELYFHFNDTNISSLRFLETVDGAIAIEIALESTEAISQFIERIPTLNSWQSQPDKSPARIELDLADRGSVLIGRPHATVAPAGWLAMGGLRGLASLNIQGNLCASFGAAIPSFPANAFEDLSHLSVPLRISLSATATLSQTIAARPHWGSLDMALDDHSLKILAGIPDDNTADKNRIKRLKSHLTRIQIRNGGSASDTGADHLTHLDSLQELTVVKGTKISKAALTKLKTVNPRLRIRHPYKDDPYFTGHLPLAAPAMRASSVDEVD